MQSPSFRKHIMIEIDLRQQEIQLHKMKASLLARLDPAENTQSQQSNCALSEQSLEIEQTDLEHAQKNQLEGGYLCQTRV